MLGVDAAANNFTICSNSVGAAFNDQLDEARLTQHYVSALLERGVRVLVYVGTLDWICNWVGNLAWVEALEWSGQAELNSKELVEWAINGKAVGKTKSAGGLTFATVYDAGHMVRPAFTPSLDLK